MTKFTLSTLKKQLSQKTHKELIQEISALCQKFPQVKDYYAAQTSDAKDVIKKYKKIIKKEFMQEGERGFPKGRLSAGKKVISDLRKLTDDPELIAEIMLTYVESVSWFNTEYHLDQEKYYVSPEDVFEKVLALIEKNNLLSKFKRQARNIVKNATDSWDTETPWKKDTKRCMVNLNKHLPTQEINGV